MLLSPFTLPIVTQNPSGHPVYVELHSILAMEMVKMAEFKQFPRIASPKGAILKVARPAQTRSNGQIPVQNDGMAGL